MTQTRDSTRIRTHTHVQRVSKIVSKYTASDQKKKTEGESYFPIPGSGIDSYGLQIEPAFQAPFLMFAAAAACF